MVAANKKVTEPKVPISSRHHFFCGRHHDLVDRYGISVSQMTTDMFHLSLHFPVLSSFITYHQVCNYFNTTGATSGARDAYPSGTLVFLKGELC
jgi:hypothetical protein